MDTSPAGEHPQQMLEAKILPQGGVQDLTGYLHELPALAANVGARAACSDLVVIRHVDIEHHLLLLQRQRCEHLPLLRSLLVHCADVYFHRLQLLEAGDQFLLRVEGLIADVDVGE